MVVTQTSIEAYITLNEERFLDLTNQQMKIYNVLRLADLTRNEISMRTGIRINAVCGRVKELIKSGLVEKNGHRVDKITNMRNEVLALSQ